MAKEKTDGQNRIHGILENLTEAERKLLSAVLNAERDKLRIEETGGDQRRSMASAHGDHKVTPSREPPNDPPHHPRPP
jgi:hypothetical protein